MTKLNATKIAAIKSAVKTGFTYQADPCFKSPAAGQRAIKALVREGYLEKVENEFGGQYEPTEAARDYVTHGLTIETVKALFA